MGNVARLFVQGGTLTFDAEVPYDQELLFEVADRYAKQQGSIRLDLDGVHWTVSTSSRQSPRCNDCGARVQALSYTDHRRHLCPRCVRALCGTTHKQYGAWAPAPTLPRKDRGPLPANAQRRSPDGV